jgi:L-threonylcarbamoyladenylate synthase
VYGLGALATDPHAVAQIFRAKGRPAFNPLIVHVGGKEQAQQYSACWNASAERLSDAFWPGPLTLILARSAGIPDVVTGGRNTVALRLPALPVTLRLLARVGQPLAAPSANRSNRVSPTRAEHVLADLDGLVDLILDSGPTSIGLESTVVDLTGAVVRILRPGPIDERRIAECLGTPVENQDLIIDEASSSRPKLASPGQLEVHYAPRKPAFRVNSVSELACISLPERAALLVLGWPAPADLPESVYLECLAQPEAAARELYETLHQFDALPVDCIVIVMPPDLPEWRAIRDRVVRASKPAR